MKRLFSLVIGLALLSTPVYAQQVQFPYVSNDSTPLRALISQVSTTTMTLFSSAGTGVRNYVTEINCVNVGPLTGLILDVYNGGHATNQASTRVARIACPANSLNGSVLFVPPLKLSATTALYVAIGTTAPAADAIHIFATGYTAR